MMRAVGVGAAARGPRHDELDGTLGIGSERGAGDGERATSATSARWMQLHGDSSLVRDAPAPRRASFCLRGVWRVAADVSSTARTGQAVGPVRGQGSGIRKSATSRRAYARARTSRASPRGARDRAAAAHTLRSARAFLVHVQRALELDLQAVAVLGRPAVLAHDLHALVRIVDRHAVAQAARDVGDERASARARRSCRRGRRARNRRARGPDRRRARRPPPASNGN